jgi:hypothetical protein
MFDSIFSYLQFQLGTLDWSLNWTNIFGLQFKLVNDKPGMLGANLASRTLIFEGMKPNSITQTRNGVSRVVNNDVRT